MRRFPFHIHISKCGLIETKLSFRIIGSGYIIIRTPVIHTELRETIIVTDSVITRHAIAATEFQGSQPITCRLHEFFIRNAPTQRKCRECTIFVVSTETGRAVTPDHTFEKIFVIIRIVHPTEYREQTPFGNIAIVRSTGRPRVQFDIERILEHIVGTTGSHECINVGNRFRTDQNREIMSTDLLRIICRIRPVPLFRIRFFTSQLVYRSSFRPS